MGVASRAVVDTVVTDDGVMVPLSELGELVPGQRVHVAVTVTKMQRRNMRGILADKIPDISLEEFEESSRAAWGNIVHATSREVLHGVVAENGDLVVSSSELEELDLVPGQRFALNVPPRWVRKKRRNVRGALAGKVRPITREEIKEASRDAWGEWVR